MASFRDEEKMAIKIITDIYGNMPPDHIDYNLIDLPLKKLIKAINKSSWARTIGSCAGMAHHKCKSGFYIMLEVKGIKGMRKFIKWLSLSHALGFKACYEKHLLKDFALPRAEIVSPNLLHGKNSVSRPVMGGGWFKFDIYLYKGEKPLNKLQTEGGIKALELGWKAVEKKPS